MNSFINNKTLDSKDYEMQKRQDRAESALYKPMKQAAIWAAFPRISKIFVLQVYLSLILTADSLPIFIASAFWARHNWQEKSSLFFAYHIFALNSRFISSKFESDNLRNGLHMMQHCQLRFNFRVFLLQILRSNSWMQYLWRYSI